METVAIRDGEDAGNGLDQSEVRFDPLRPASRRRLVGGLIAGPFAWLIVMSVAAWLLDYSWAVGLGLLVTLVSFLASLIALVILRRRRLAQEARYADAG